MSFNRTSRTCVVDCGHRLAWETKLLYIPKDLPETTTTLTLEDNHIYAVNSTPFNHMTHLNHLILAFNNISHVTAISVKSLITYELQHNNLTAIDRHMFKGLYNLSSLILNNNRISRIENGSFDGLESLERLDLMRNELAFGSHSYVPLALFD